MAIQQAKYEAAMKDLQKAQAQLDDKQRELDAVQAMYDKAMREKQVWLPWLPLYACFFYSSFRLQARA